MKKGVGNLVYIRGRNLVENRSYVLMAPPNEHKLGNLAYIWVYYIRRGQHSVQKG